MPADNLGRHCTRVSPLGAGAASGGQSFRQLQPPFVQGPADDAAGHVQPRQIGHIPGRGHSARGDHRHVDGALHFGHGRQVGTGQHSVGGDVGIDDGRDRFAGHLAGQIGGLNLAGLKPTVAGHAAIAGVDAQHQAAWKLPADLAEPIGLAQRLGADHQPRQAQVQQIANRRRRRGCRRPVRREPIRPPGSPAPRPGFRLGRCARRRDRPGAKTVRLDRPNAGPSMPDRRRTRFRAGSRPARDGRTCRREDRLLARFASCRALKCRKEPGNKKYPTSQLRLQVFAGCQLVSPGVIEDDNR